jgi:hypothetical protein
MRTELKLFILTLGLSVSFAQGEGHKAVGLYFSKDSFKALSTRLALGGSPYLSLKTLAGLGQRGQYIAGLSFQHLFELGGGCRGGACYRRGTLIQPYIDVGMRMIFQTETAQSALQGVVGGGLMMPIGPVEVFAQIQGVKPLSAEGLRLDLGGGLRLRF